MPRAPGPRRHPVRGFLRAGASATIRLMKALFIGGTGVISAAVSRLAVERGIDLTLLNRGRQDEFFPRGANQIVADSRDRKATLEAPAASASSPGGRSSSTSSSREVPAALLLPHPDLEMDGAGCAGCQAAEVLGRVTGHMQTVSNYEAAQNDVATPHGKSILPQDHESSHVPRFAALLT
mgnify:CR=1 FL=1